MVESATLIQRTAIPTLTTSTSTSRPTLHRTFIKPTSIKMATQPTAAPTPSTTVPDLTSSGIPLLSQLPQLPNHNDADPKRSPLDHFRLAIADQASKALHLPLEKVFEAVQHPTKGADFSLAVPRFRLPGKPNEHAQKVAEAVSTLTLGV